MTFRRRTTGPHAIRDPRGPHATAALAASALGGQIARERCARFLRCGVRASALSASARKEGADEKMFVSIKRVAIFAGFSTLFALSAGCAAKAPEAKAPEAPGQDSAEMSLLGIGADAPATQVSEDESAAKAKAASAKDDGSDIIPPFSSKAPPKKKAARKSGKKK
jgi:hypothetical protein